MIRDSGSDSDSSVFTRPQPKQKCLPELPEIELEATSKPGCSRKSSSSFSTSRSSSQIVQEWSRSDLEEGKCIYILYLDECARLKKSRIIFPFDCNTFLGLPALLYILGTFLSMNADFKGLSPDNLKNLTTLEAAGPLVSEPRT